MYRIGGPAVAALLVAPWLWASDAAQPASKPKKEAVEKTIQELGAENYKVRTAAAKALERFGPEVLPFLKEAFRKSDDPEVRRRIEDMLPGMEHAAALSPTRITLSFKDKPVKEVLAELSKQAGYKFDISPQGDQREKKQVTLEMKDAPFWVALDRVCATCGLYFQEGWYGGDQASIRLEYGEAANAPGLTYFDGPFRVSARGFNYSRNVDFLNGPRRVGPQGAAPQLVQRSETLQMNISISVEPKLPLLSVNQPSITEAADENNQSLIPPNQGQTHYSYYHGYRSFTHQVQAQLTPSKDGKTIKSLKGTIPVTAISAQREKLVIEKILDVKNKSFKAGNTTVNVESVTRSGEEIEIKLNVTEGAEKGGPNNMRVNTLNQRFGLFDEKGTKFYGYFSRWTGQGNGGGGTMRFHNNGQNVGDPVRLVLYEWTTVSHAVPFEFKELPLP
jgi:hypothetical protein